MLDGLAKLARQELSPSETLRREAPKTLDILARAVHDNLPEVLLPWLWESRIALQQCQSLRRQMIEGDVGLLQSTWVDVLIGRLRDISRKIEGLTRRLSTLPSNIEGRTAKRRALLVGISYRGSHNSWSALDGPHEDVDRFRQLLTNTYGYHLEDITVLKDDPDLPYLSHPTRVNMIRELERLVSDAAPGDTFVFLYSGHSDQRLAIDDFAEEDGQDEMIITSDENFILDNELDDILVPLPIGCSLMAILDTSHSGTLLDLPHYHCNSVYVPWLSKGARRTLTIQNKNVRRQATNFPRSTPSSKPLPLIATFMDSQEPGDQMARLPLRVDDWASEGLSVDQRESSRAAQIRETEQPRGLWLFPSLPRSASPEPMFFCDGWCDCDDNSYPTVLSLSACSDSQRAWEGPNGSLTTVLCNYLKSHSRPSYQDLMSHINFQLHSNALELHKYTRDQKKRAYRGNGDGFDGELDNFQEPVLSSLAKLDMDEILKF